MCYSAIEQYHIMMYVCVFKYPSLINANTRYYVAFDSLNFVVKDTFWSESSTSSCSRCTAEENDFELAVVMLQVIHCKCQNPPHSVL